jgi:hypothetical protein
VKAVEYWIGFGGLLEGSHDWADALFLVTRGRSNFSYIVRFTGELQRKWGLEGRSQVEEAIKRYGFRAVKEALRQDRQVDGSLIMLSSDTCLEKGTGFLERPPYELPLGDLVRFVVQVEGGGSTAGREGDVGA